MRGSLAVALLLLSVSAARAQDTLYVAAVGGVTFQADTAGLFGGEAGIRISDNLTVFGQAGRMLDVLPRSVRDDLDDASVTLEDFTGRAWDFDARIRADYFGGGIRYVLPLGSRIRPYALGGIAAVNYKGSLRERELGDVLDQAIALGVVDEEDVRGTEIGYEIGGGLITASRRLRLDAGYRLMNVKGVNISRLLVTVGRTFR